MFQLGIDVNKKTLDLCLLCEGVKDGVKTQELQDDINAVNIVIAWLGKRHHKPKDVHVTMGATGVHCKSPVYGLHKVGGRISLANSYKARGFVWGMGMLTKDDWVDVYTLACYGALEVPEPWLPPSEGVRHLGALFHRRDVLVVDSTREENRLEKCLAIGIPPVIAESVEVMIGQLNVEIKYLDRLIRSHPSQHLESKKDFDLLMSVESVSHQLGLNMLVILRSHDLTTIEQAAASLSVVPVGKYSGTLVGGCPKLSEIGPPEVRAKLYLASLCGLGLNLLMEAMCERLCLRGKGKMCVIGALMRKLVHWCCDVLRTRKPFDAGYLSSYARSVCKAA